MSGQASPSWAKQTEGPPVAGRETAVQRDQLLFFLGIVPAGVLHLKKLAG